MNAQPNISVSFFGLLIVVMIVMGSFAGIAWLGHLVRRQQQSRDDQPTRFPSSIQFGLVGVAAALLIVAFLGLFVAGFKSQPAVPQSPMPPMEVARELAPLPQEVRIERVDQHQSSPERIPLASEPATAERPLPTTPPAQPDKPLPEWTKHELTVLVDAQIPDVLLVRKSRPSATEAEAVTEARALAIVAMKQRLAPQYPEIESWPMPVQVFRTHAIKQEFVERKLHNFGSFEEPMFVAYVQFEDAPGIREPIIADWQASRMESLVQRFGIGFAIMTLSLAALSAGLRAFSSGVGQSRHRATAIAIALAVAVAALFVS